MSPAQLTALRAFLLDCLRQPVDFGGPALPFEDDACYRANLNVPRAVYPLCVFQPIASTSLGQGEQAPEHCQQLLRLRFDTNPAGPFTLTLTPQNTLGGGVFSPMALAITPGATAKDTATATRAAIQAYTPPVGEDLPLVADYDTSDGQSVLIEGTPKALGANLAVDGGTASDDLAVTVIRDNYIEHVRDLQEVLVSIRLWSKLDELDPDDNLDAVAWLERVRLATFDDTLTGGLFDARCPILDRSDVRDLAQLTSGGAEFVTAANLDLTLSVHPYRIAQPGTIESVGLAATIVTPAGATTLTTTIP